MKPKTVYAALVASAFLTAAPDLVATDLPRQPAAAETLGRVDFPVSCTPEAQRRFTGDASHELRTPRCSRPIPRARWRIGATP